MSHPGWPATLVDGPVVVRPLRYSDAAAWREVRRANRDWLSPWEATAPGQPLPEPSLVTFATTVSRLRRQAARGRALPMAMAFEGRFVGQLTVGGIVRGATSTAYVGYWIDQRFAGRGITSNALALVVDHCFGAVGLDRVEANVRPENSRSRRVVERLGFRVDGLRPRFLYIDGDWRDHICYALTPQDVPEGLLARWHAMR